MSSLPEHDDGFDLPALSRQAEVPSLVVMVAVGGLDAAAWRGPDAAMPTLARLAEAGAAAERVEAVAPASHSPAMATLATGRSPTSHRITSERLLGERGVRRVGFGHASLLRGPTLWSAAAESRRSVAALGWPTTVGAAVPLLVPDVGIPPRDVTWLDELGDKATPGLIEALRAVGGAAPETAFPGPARDRALLETACALLATPTPPTLVLLHLGAARAPIAQYGPTAPAARAALGAVDADLERLLRCLWDVGRLEATALVVAGDHGSAPAHTALAPNTVLAAAGLLTRAGGDSVSAWRALARSNGGSAFVYARSAQDALTARDALAREADASGTFRVVSAEELLEQGADPEAWFGLEARAGYSFSDDVAVAFESASALRGAGGYLPARAAMSSSLVAWGRGVRAGVRIPWMRQVDVAPTVARLAGFPLDEAEGRPLVGLLNLPRASAPAAN